MDSCSKEEAPVRGERSHYALHNHIEITRIQPGEAEGVLTVHQDSLNLLNVVHGGGLASLADSVAGTAVAATGGVGVTLNSTMNYLRPAAGSKITCVGRVRKAGKTIVLCDVDLTNDQGVLVATGTFTFYRNGMQEMPELEGQN